MNLLLLYSDDFITDTIAKINGRRFLHLTKIINVSKDQTIEVGLLNSKLGKGKIIEVDADSITIETELHQQPPIAASITLVLALPRPLMMKRILQTVTTMGLKQIHLIHSQQVEKSYWGSSDMADDVIHQQLLLGLEQARDTVLPKIHFHKHFKPFVKNELPNLIQDKLPLLAHLGNYTPCPTNVQQHTVLAVGPEGGFISDEVEQLISVGFQAVQLGERPLRVESAVTALLGRLLAV